MEDEELSDALALVLAQAVVNKLSDSLAVVKVKKQGYSWSEVKAKALVERMQYKQKRRSRHLVTHSKRWRLRYCKTHTVKN